VSEESTTPDLVELGRRNNEAFNRGDFAVLRANHGLRGLHPAAEPLRGRWGSAS